MTRRSSTRYQGITCTWEEESDGVWVLLNPLMLRQEELAREREMPDNEKPGYDSSTGLYEGDN